jgi:aminopeptidase 2
MIKTNAFRVPIRVYAAVNKNISHGKLALSLVPRTLSAFGSIFNVPFQLLKMDLIAVPGAPGAIES